MSRDRLLTSDHRPKFFFSIISVLGILGFGIIGVIVGYVYIGFSDTLAMLVISGFGALSTVFLVLVTFLTFAENYRLTQQSRQRPLVREEIGEVILPAIEVLDHNISAVEGQAVDWEYILDNFHSSRESSGSFPNFAMSRLEPLTERDDLDTVVFDRFLEKNQDFKSKFEEHDERAEELAERAEDLIEILEEDLEDHIHKRGMTYERASTELQVEENKIANFVLDQTEELSDTNHLQPVWENHRDEFIEVAEEAAPDRLPEFWIMRDDYRRFCLVLQDQLKRKRSELQTTHRISLGDQE